MAIHIDCHGLLCLGRHFTGGRAGFAIAIAKRDEGTLQIAGALTLTLAYAINASFAHVRSGSEYLGFGAAALLGIALFAALWMEDWRKRVLFLSGPFFVSSWLLGTSWAQHEVLSTRVSIIFNLGLPLLVLSFVAIAAAGAHRVRRGRPAPPLRSALAAFACFGVLATLGVIRSRIPSPPAGQIAELRGKPNVLLITMDTVRADHLSLYGYERDTTPNLCEFARTASVFSNAIATSDFTLPTHASIFTGLYPGWLGPIYAPPQRPTPVPLQPGHTTLAEILSAKGYWTVESVANHVYLSPSTGLTRGFMFSDWSRPVNIATDFRGFYLRDRAWDWLSPWFPDLEIHRPYRSATEILQRGRDFLGRAKASGRPFFLFLNFMDAHLPYVSDPPFNSRFTGGDRGLRKPANLTARVNRGERILKPSELRQLIAQYDGGIAAEDSALGELFQELRKLGLFDNTMIVVTADHGEGFMEHDILDHAHGLVDQTYLHVPLLVKYPSQRAATRSNALVSQIDILPTILEGLGFSPPNPSQGQSLSGPPRDESSAVFAEAQASSVNSPNRRLRGLRRTILAGAMKLVWWSDGPPEMYDLSADGGEEHNLYGPTDARAANLSKHLADWVAAIPRSRPATHKLDRSTMERLRSLGHVQ